MLRELAMRAPGLENASLVSIFFGGGTPSLWDTNELARVKDSIVAAFPHVADNVEITVECNPSSLNREKAKALAAAGINRLSIGVQSLDDARLRFLGRLHDAEGGLKAVGEAMLEMPRVSADLMFGMPDQTGEDFASEVNELLALGLKHVSAYSLTIEPNTQFGALAKKGRLPLAVEDDVAECFAQGKAVFKEHGLDAYEVSNYATLGEEARHNQHYWRGGDYLGLGAGAVGCLASSDHEARRYRNNADPTHYMQHAASSDVEDSEETLSPADRVREAIMLGLRTREGMSLGAVHEQTGLDPLLEREKSLKKRLETGDVILEDGYLRVPSTRWLTMDSIVRDLF